MNLRPVDRDHPDLDQAGLGTEHEHLAEQAGQRRLVTLSKARNRRVVGRLIGADHARGHVLNAAPLDPSRGPFTDRVRVHQQRHHHRRIMRRPPVPIGAISGIERGQIELPDGIDNEPREVILAAATRAGSAATTAPARDHTPRSSAACRHPLNRAGQTAPLCNSLLECSSGQEGIARRLAPHGDRDPSCPCWSSPSSSRRSCSPSA